MDVSSASARAHTYNTQELQARLTEKRRRPYFDKHRFFQKSKEMDKYPCVQIAFDKLSR